MLDKTHLTIIRQNGQDLNGPFRHQTNPFPILITLSQQPPPPSREERCSIIQAKLDELTAAAMALLGFAGIVRAGCSPAMFDSAYNMMLVENGLHVWFMPYEAEEFKDVLYPISGGI